MSSTQYPSPIGESIGEWTPHKTVATYLKYAKSWAKAAERYEYHSSYSAIKGRSLFNMEHFVARIKEATDRQLNSAEETCHFVMDELYATTNGYYDRWEACLEAIRAEKEARIPLSSTEFYAQAFQSR